MPARSTAGRAASVRIAAVERWHGPDDPRLPELRRDLRAAEAEDYIARLVAAAPPLTDKQRAHLAALLRPSGPDNT